MAVPKRINHAGHKHPDTKYARKKCREAMIAADLVAEGQALIERQPKRTYPVRKTRAAVRSEQPEKVREQRRSMSLSTIRALGESLDSTAELLGQFAQVESVTVRLRMEDHSVTATFDGDDWLIESP